VRPGPVQEGGDVPPAPSTPSEAPRCSGGTSGNRSRNSRIAAFSSSGWRLGIRPKLSCSASSASRKESSKSLPDESGSNIGVLRHQGEEIDGAGDVGVPDVPQRLLRAQSALLQAGQRPEERPYCLLDLGRLPAQPGRRPPAPPRCTPGRSA